MATFQLLPGFDDVIMLTDEADTIVIAAGDRSQDRVFNFDPASDRIDVSAIAGVTPQELLDSIISQSNSLLLVGSFGSIELLEVAADQLSEDNFIIGGGNEPPIALDDFAMTMAGTAAAIFVLDNDFDFEGDILSIIDFEATTIAGGTVSLDNNDTPDDPFDDFLTYMPAADFFGTDSFIYTISDGLATATATVNVEVVLPVEPPPVATDDFAETTQDIPVDIDVLANDFTIGVGPEVAIASFAETTANGGTVILNDNGTPSDAFDDSLEYIPAEGFTGTDSFSYSISNALNVAEASVTVQVNSIDDTGLVASDDTAIAREDRSETIAVLENDFNPEGRAFGLIFFERTTENGGTIARDNNDTPRLTDDKLVYTPAAGFTGTDSFTYSIGDARGNISTATVDITVESAPEPGPVATDDRASVAAGESETIAVLENDFNPDGDSFGLIFFERTTENGGTVTRDNNDTPRLTDDKLIYTAADGFIGEDSFTYSIGDALGNIKTATVTVIVNPELGLPLIAEDDFATTLADIPVNISVLDNDSGPDGVVELIDFEDVTGNGGIVSLENNGTPNDLTDDFLNYLPAFGFFGTDSFSYSIGDGSGQTATGFVTVEVGPAGNAPPIAADDFAETVQGISVNIDPLNNDFDESGNRLGIIDFAQTTENGGTVTRDEDGSLMYTPPVGFTGTDGFSYRVGDGSGITDTAFVSIVVDRIHQDLPPLILDQEVYTFFNEPVDIFVLENEFDPRDIRREILDFEETPEGGTVTLDDNGTPEDPTDDFLTYSPTDGFIGTDAFSYSISDDRGLTSTAFATVTVLPEGQSAVAIDDFTNIFLPEENQVNIFVLENDFSLNGDAIALTDFDETTEGGGTVTRNNNDTPEDLTDDFLIYTAGEEFSSTDSFTYSISDGSSTDTAVVDVVNFFTIAPPFLPTVFAADDRAFITANSPANIPVLDNDFSFQQSAELTDFDDSTAAGGTITRDENGTAEDLTDDLLVYTPATDFVGTDSFTYSIIDDFSPTSSTAVVNVVVVPANSTVFAADDNAEVIKNNPTSIFVLENDFEVNGNPLEILDFDETTVNGGTVSLEGFFLPEIDEPIDDIIIDPFPPIGGQGYLLYSPADGFTGTDSFTYSISNPDGVTDTATVRVTVAPSPPFAGFAFGETFENAPVTIDVLSSAFDFDRDSIFLTDLEGTSTFGGTVSLEDNGTPSDQTDDLLVYEPATGFTGFDDFNYTITDSSGLTDVGEVSVNILPAPAGFATVDDFVQTVAGLPVKVGVLDNDFEIDDEPLELISFERETENGGIVTRFENNTPSDQTDDFLVYEPGEFDSEFFGSDSFSYTIANADGSTDTGVASVSIAPILTTFANFDDAYTFADLPINIDVLANDFTVDNSPVELIDFETTTEFAEGAIARDDKGTDDLTDDSLIYTPAEGFTGYDEFSYSISDAEDNTTIGFVSVTVDPLPEAGFAAVNDFVNTSGNEPVTIPVLDNDFDGEGNLALDSFEETTFYGGTIARDGDELIYTPPAEGENDFLVFFDSFSYTVRDPDSNLTDRALVEIQISPEPPSAEDDSAETLLNTAVNIPVLDNDFGVGSEPGDLFSRLVITGFETTTANGGQVILDNNDSRPFDPAISDSLIYIPAPGFTGTDSFSYNISDGFFGPFGANATSTALVTVTVLPETETLGL
ncbi:MAG: Ig-like domain-containing protein [Hormoscilla sp.]